MRRKFKDSILFQKQLKKLKGQDLLNVMKKIEEILICKDINHFKNLKHDLKKFKRVHVNNSYVIIFFGNDSTVYFVDYRHHDTIYKHNKKSLEKYKNLKFY